MKVLIPSYAAGSIIGKGGQTIVQLQKETGATIKLSKSKDFYPGKSLDVKRKKPTLDFKVFSVVYDWLLCHILLPHTVGPSHESTVLSSVITVLYI